MRTEIAFAAAMLAAGSAPANAGTIETGAPIEARRALGRVELDGRLDETDWRAAAPLDQFYEYYPGDRTTPRDRTSVYFLYDDRYLYVGFRAELAEPDQLRTPFVRRDRVGSSHDYVQVFLDPLGTRRSAYLFRVNARGVKTDGVRIEGQSETTDPDFDWDATTHIDAAGWTAELRIPFSTLRIDNDGSQVWTVVATRGVPRANNTQMASAPYPHDSTCFLCRASTLSLPDLQPKTERVIAWASAVGLQKQQSGDNGHSDTDIDLSLDLKWLPYAGAAVDLTVRPDFSQVEADSPQLTANARFALSLPEKRPFFREATDLLSIPIPAIYTRSIVAPDFGARFTHRSSGLNATAFAAQDAGRPAIIEPGFLGSEFAFPDFASTVAFARGVQSWGATEAGGVYVAKYNEDGSRNVLAGADLNWGDDKDRISAQMASSWTRNPDRPDLLGEWRGQSMDGGAYYARWDHTGRAIWSLQYTRFDDGFRAWLGFAPRVGYEEAFLDLRLPFYFSNGLVNDVTPYVQYDSITGLSMDGEEGGAIFGVAVGATRSSNFDISLHPDQEVLTQLGDERRVSFVQWTASATPSPRVPLVQLNGRYGDAVDFSTGEVVGGWALNSVLRLRPIDRLELEARYAVEALGDRPDGELRLMDSSVEGLATWYFGPAIYVLADYQLHTTESRAPLLERSEFQRASLQFIWSPLLAWQAYLGARIADPDDGARSFEYYFKVTRRLSL